MGSHSKQRTNQAAGGPALQDVFSHSLRTNNELDEQVRDLYVREKLSLKQISERLKVSRDRIRAGLSRLGIPIEHERRALDFTGQTPFGWKREKGRLVPHRAEQRIVVRMAGARTRGVSLHGIARDLTADGVGTKNGGKWQARSISQILDCNARLLSELGSTGSEPSRTQ